MVGIPFLQTLFELLFVLQALHVLMRVEGLGFRV
jgi:hypothetical protein